MPVSRKEKLGRKGNGKGGETSAIAGGFDPNDVQLVPIADLVPDPLNARIHPERNTKATMASLKKYGQMKPIVVRKQTNVVVAGNGTLEAAKRLGWTHISAYVKDMTDTEAWGYGLADNRTAELAAWDYEVVETLRKLSAEQGVSITDEGWNSNDIKLARLEADIQPSNPEPPAEKFGVLVLLDSEEAQLNMIEDMMERGLECRALTF